MDERFPIGHFKVEGVISAEQREAWIRDIEELPVRAQEAVQGLSAEQLDIPYRDGGWSSRQVVHHMADSHMNSYIRFKLALTEDVPTIRPYYEDRWAELNDYTADVSVSLALLAALHTRWAILLRSLSDEEYKRTFHHPESGQTLPLEYHLGVYSWHGRHHTAHITSLRKKLGI
ncbi:YfiT family bacillithiol transferase [Paenibacillus sp. sgz500958]|uniref:YfiT family bacillithiol transferase n=1 Tax=Paenibacillus sp. sgz500958 TaxID=3242475 RepID=UPI0036D26745